MSVLASLLIKSLGRASNGRFEAATRDTQAAQQRKLLEILQRNAETEYGRVHGFAKVRTLEDWRAAAPVITYEHVRAEMDRVVAGEKNVLTAEDPVLFARTSGTTGSAKYVPVTPACRGTDTKDQMRVWFHHAMKQHPKIFSGKVISLVSPAVEGYTPSGIPYGSTSGHIYKNMPGLVKSTYLVPYPVFEVEDYVSKYYTIMRLGLGAPVTFLATANPSSIIKMCEMANEHAETLLKDLHDGTLKADLQISAAVRQEVEARLKANPGECKRLEAQRSRRAGMLLPADYWPHLKLIGCWKGGTVGSYLSRFPGWFDPEGTNPMPVRDWGYLSSEARGSIPISDIGCGGVLTIQSNVYEFIPTEDVDSSPDDHTKWTFLGAHEIERNKEYYIIFTTTGGLYRYDINDVIRVVDVHNTAPVIEFLRKGRGMTNITGEKVSVNQVIEAFNRTSESLGIPVDHFKAEADIPGSRYIFKAEAPDGIPKESCRKFLQQLDSNLAAINIEYEAKRKSLRLNPPVLHVMKPGWYDNQKKQLIAEGKRLFQAKTVLLSNRDATDGADDLLSITEMENQ